MILKMAGEQFYNVGDIVDLAPGTAEAWVKHGVAMYVDDERPVATKLYKPEDIHPLAIEVIDTEAAVDPVPVNTKKARVLNKSEKPKARSKK